MRGAQWGAIVARGRRAPRGGAKTSIFVAAEFADTAIDGERVCCRHEDCAKTTEGQRLGKQRASRAKRPEEKRRKFAVLVALACAATFVAPAFGGAKQNPSVTITATTAQGALGTAWNSTDT